ncbi:hypothetical protein BABINDRAFT_162644 [Babjeviella inositovora NRRL Y-12698]|uniref:Mediator of RNA polymerase II transcription subunit 10 n=1 Tax=Babjeviella inositovora NRRL Y-12698 TaxID=984486 RepID=A0A1E3QL40_9ASCO|nr:uncharacterized protein BABINDRAFT_162644 [Babjeviella inositovora NRRL Y-12698]ODQ78416.1 hypothetical protein BABINDRAFT_162644 [Babjeviella inositovora NRRL Y-12698]
MTTTSMDVSSEVLVATKNQMSHLIEAFMELGVMVHDFQGTEQARNGASIRLNQTLEDLAKLAAYSSENLKDVPIPLDVLQYIEDGRNPDVYTREFIESTSKLGGYLSAKVKGMDKLKKVLGAKIAQEFPELDEVVDEIINTTALPETER